MLTAFLTDEICQSRRIREHRLYSLILAVQHAHRIAVHAPSRVVVKLTGMGF